MRRAGCVGINFGVDSGCDRMLAALGRNYTRQAIREAVLACRREGIVVMLDLLVGAPGEDENSLRETVEFIRRVGPDRAGAAVGVRLYPATPLAAQVVREGPLQHNPNLRGHVHGNENLLRPVFYVQDRLGPDPVGLLAEIVGDDERFFLPTGADRRDYNYNDNAVLEGAIRAGYRGAFWDILRRLVEDRR